MTAAPPDTVVAGDLSRQFAAFAAGLEYQVLPAPAVTGAKKTLLDSIGVTLAASGAEPAVRPVVDLVRESGGRSESTVFGAGFKAPATEAAFANGAMAHSLNFDDQTPWGQHSSSTVVPAVLAVAERVGGVSGRDLIAAVAVGQDLFARLRCNVSWKQDWNLSTVLGTFAATAAAGRVLRLTPEQLTHAFGVASMQAGGVMELVTGLGSQLGGLYAGFPARAAVMAALLAQKGTTGHPAVFEGRLGFFATYFGGKYDRAAMVADLGEDFKGSYTLYKPWAAIGTAHSHIHAMIDVATRLDLQVDDIDSITVFVGDCHEALCAPLPDRQSPANLLDARFSLPFLVAVAAVRRGMRVADLTTETLSDAVVLDLANRITPVSDPALDWKLELPHGRIEVVLRDGRRIVAVGNDVPGSAAAPLTWTDLTTKFADCAAAAAIPPSMQAVTLAQQLLQDLENVQDATQLIRLLAGPFTR